MKRILQGMLVLGLAMAMISGCEMFKKKPAETTDDKVAMQEVTPDTNAKAETEQPAEEAAPAPATTGGRTHIVQRGDTLFSLARKYYNGDQSQWRRIWEANRAQIPNKDQLKVGQQLIIP